MLTNYALNVLTAISIKDKDFLSFSTYIPSIFNASWKLRFDNKRKIKMKKEKEDSDSSKMDIPNPTCTRQQKTTTGKEKNYHVHIQRTFSNKNEAASLREGSPLDGG